MEINQGSSGGVGVSGHVIKEDGTPLTQRANLNFIGAGVTATDNPGTDSTDVTVPLGGGGTVTSVASANGSITVTNPSTTPDLAVVQSPKLTTGRTISTTGDVAYTSGSFDGTGNVTGAATLATVNANLGSFGTASATGQFTVNAKGLITAAASVAISIVSSAVTDFAATVRATVLTGLSVVSTTVISATDTVLVALGSLQAQITALTTVVTGKVDSTRTISTTAPLSGGGDLSANRTFTTSMATNKLIGRGTAGTGVMEEITLGTNLSFTGTTLNASGGAGGFTVTEAEINFGTIPVTDKTFTITNASITAASKIICTESGTAATGRASGDSLWDSITYSALAGTGTFTLYARASGAVVGTRNFMYSFS